MYGQTDLCKIASKYTKNPESLAIILVDTYNSLLSMKRRFTKIRRVLEKSQKMSQTSDNASVEASEDEFKN